MNKIFRLWLAPFMAAAFLCALSLCPTESFALTKVYAEGTTTEGSTEVIMGACGTNVTYSIKGDTITISGTGAMNNYNLANNAPYYSYLSNITTVVISDGVTSIGESAFERCSALTSVTIPSSVTNIGSYAFQYCHKLTSITIPSGVTNISEYAFSNCSGLTSVEIQNGVTAIGDHAFYNCSVLTSVKIPSSVTTIGNSAFSDCTKLADSLTIPNSVTSIGDKAFYNCTGLTEITVLNKDATINSSGDAFYGVSRLRCFQNSTASKYTRTSGTAPQIVYVQDQSSFETISIPKPTDGKWIQKVELIISINETPKKAELTRYRLEDENYVFPVLMYADSYMGDERKLSYQVKYYYNYDKTEANDDAFVEPLPASEDNSGNNTTDPSKVYYVDLTNDTAEFEITEVTTS